MKRYLNLGLSHLNHLPEKSNDKDLVFIYADGCSYFNYGASGYILVKNRELLKEEVKTVFSEKGIPDTNILELQGLIDGLKNTPVGTPVALVSDSLNALTVLLAYKYNLEFKPAFLNQQMGEEVAELVQKHNIQRIQKVKGHVFPRNDYFFWNNYIDNALMQQIEKSHHHEEKFKAIKIFVGVEGDKKRNRKRIGEIRENNLKKLNKGVGIKSFGGQINLKHTNSAVRQELVKLAQEKHIDIYEIEDGHLKITGVETVNFFPEHKKMYALLDGKDYSVHFVKPQEIIDLATGTISDFDLIAIKQHQRSLYQRILTPLG